MITETFLRLCEKVSVIMELAPVAGAGLSAGAGIQVPFLHQVSVVRMSRPANNGLVCAQPLWLDGGTVVDGTGRDPRPGTGILVEAGRIARVGGSRPRDATVLDCGELVLTPGLIDGFAGDPLSVPEHFADRGRVALVLQEGRVAKSSTES